MAKSFKGTSKLAEFHHGPEGRQRRLAGKAKVYGLKDKVFEASKKPRESRSESMKRVRVKSNFARSKTLVLGPRSELVLRFDRHGECSMPEHMLPILEAVMQARPGRFSVMASDAVDSHEGVISHDDAADQVKQLLAKLSEEEEEVVEDEDEDDELEAAIELVDDEEELEPDFDESEEE